MRGLVLEQHFLPVFLQNIEPKLWPKGAGDKGFIRLQELLSASEPIDLGWGTEDGLFCLILQDGTVVHLILGDLVSGDLGFHLERLLGGGGGELISDVGYTSEQVMFLYPDARLVIARSRAQAPDDPSPPETQLDTFLNFLPSLASKRTAKRLVLHPSEDQFLVWWSRLGEDVFPWSPKPEQRANVLLYRFQESVEPHLAFFTRTESNLVLADFVPESQLILTLEEMVDPMGRVTLRERVSGLDGSLAERLIGLESGRMCEAYDVGRSRLALATADSSIIISDPARTASARTPFIGRTIAWHPDSCLLFLAGDKGQLQIYDIALSALLLFGQNEPSPSLTYELKPTRPITALVPSPASESSESLLFIRSEAGNLSVVRLGVGQMGILQLVQHYAGNGQYEEGINVLEAAGPDSEEAIQALYHLFGRLCRSDWDQRTEDHFEHLLGIYSWGDVGGGSVLTLVRRYFVWLSGARRLESALKVGIRLGDKELLYRLRTLALLEENLEVAEEVLKHVPGRPSHSSCSGDDSSWTHPTSCSTCSSSDEHPEEDPALPPAASRHDVASGIKVIHLGHV